MLKKMVNKKYKIVLLVLSVILLGLVALYFYTKDEKVYTIKSYDPDTKKTNILQYVIREGEIIPHGKSIYYDEKGNKIKQNNWVNGKISGESISYFDNGKIKSIHYMKSSKIKMEAIWYYPNGNIESYMLYDDFGIPGFEASYDEQGNVKSHKGLPFVEIYQYKIAHKEQFKIETNQYLKVGDTLKYEYLLANIPKAQRSFTIEMLESDNTKIKRTITKKPPVGIEVEEILIKKGKNAIKGVLEYKFNDAKKTVIRDSVYFEVNVN